jgi:hypothetical protein
VLHTARFQVPVPYLKPDKGNACQAANLHSVSTQLRIEEWARRTLEVKPAYTTHPVGINSYPLTSPTKTPRLLVIIISIYMYLKLLWLWRALFWSAVPAAFLAWRHHQKPPLYDSGHLSLRHVFYRYSCMLEMAFSGLFLRTNPQERYQCLGQGHPSDIDIYMEFHLREEFVDTIWMFWSRASNACMVVVPTRDIPSSPSCSIFVSISLVI